MFVNLLQVESEREEDYFFLCKIIENKFKMPMRIIIIIRFEYLDFNNGRMKHRLLISNQSK